METPVKEKKIKLAVAPGYDFALFAIVSSMNIHNLSWAINQQMNLSLMLQDDYEVQNKTQLHNKRFVVYACTDEENFTQVTLISNNSENGKLVRELSNVDYFLRLSGDISDTKELEWLEKILDVRDITMANKLNLDILGFRNKTSFLSVFLDICKTYL